MKNDAISLITLAYGVFIILLALFAGSGDVKGLDFTSGASGGSGRSATLADESAASRLLVAERGHQAAILSGDPDKMAKTGLMVAALRAEVKAAKIAAKAAAERK